jgi:serine/threonine protein kinase
MCGGSTFDDELVRRLPHPLAQLYRRAHNTKNPLDRHLTAFDLWEASLKLLGSAAVVTYAERGGPAPGDAEALSRLARPTLGDWWRFVRVLVPTLAEAGDEGFRAVREGLLGRSRDDLPRAAGLDAVLREVLDGTSGARVVVRLDDLYDRLVNYRNRVLGHGAPGQRTAEFHERMGRAILAGTAELLARLDALAGRRLIYVREVSRHPSGSWLVERYDLTGEAHRRLDPAEVKGPDAGRSPTPGRVYLQAGPIDSMGPAALVAIHPLLVYDFEAGETLFLNARRGKRRGVYLGYSSGRESEFPDVGDEHRALLARVLGMEVDTAQVERWVAASVAEEAEEPLPSGAPARMLGEFELLAKLGQGGMGVVFRAWQPSVGRQVALKGLLRAGDAKSEARFAREIRALGRVDHPNLVKIFTSGSQGDEWFYAMELVERATLEAVALALQDAKADAPGLDMAAWREALKTACARSRQAERPFGGTPPELARPARAEPDVPPDWAVAGDYFRHMAALVRQVCAAAHALHEAKVVHRDIKPGNIMVSPDGSQAVLMDLGLAQLADELEGRLTRTRQFVGTLRYASPEQVLAVDRLDRRSDVYSLGVLLWELLTHRPLYDATEQTPTAELMKRIQYTEPEPVRKFDPGIPRDLEAIVLRCLEKDPARRYQTALGLAEDLDRWLTGRPVEARPRTPGYVLARAVRRNRGWIGLAAAAVVLQAALGAGLYLQLRPVPGRPEPVPTLPGPVTVVPPRPAEETPPGSVDVVPSQPAEPPGRYYEDYGGYGDVVLTKAGAPLKVVVRRNTSVRADPHPTMANGQPVKMFEFFYVLPPVKGFDPMPTTKNDFYWVSTSLSGRAYGWIHKDDVFEWPHLRALGLRPPAGRSPVLIYDLIEELRAACEGASAVKPVARELAAQSGFGLMPILEEGEIDARGKKLKAFRVAFLTKPAGPPQEEVKPGKSEVLGYTLDVVIVIATTRGMQPHIDAVRKAVDVIIARSGRNRGRSTHPVRTGGLPRHDRQPGRRLVRRQALLRPEDGSRSSGVPEAAVRVPRGQPGGRGCSGGRPGGVEAGDPGRGLEPTRFQAHRVDRRRQRPRRTRGPEELATSHDQ